MPSSSVLFRGAFASAVTFAFACSTSNPSSRLDPVDGGADAAVDANKPPTDHGLTRSTCDEDRIATDEGVLLYRTIESAGGSRSFHVLRPAAAKCTTKSALVVLVHPSLSTDTVKKNPGDYYARQQLVTENAASNGYIVAAPNALAADGQFTLSADNANDMTFVSDLIDAVTLKEPVNPKRVYVIGFGEGGALALKSACDFSSRVACVASVGGGLLKTTKASCKPSEGVSVVLGAGTKDTVIPYNGNDEYETFTDSRDFFLTAMGCGDETTTSTDGANIVTYTTCKNSAQVQTIQETGGTHESIVQFLLPAYDNFLKKRFKS